MQDRVVRFKGLINNVWWHASPTDSHWLVFWSRVEYRTICEYTGCNDKLHHKIYEGDVVRYFPTSKRKKIIDCVVVYSPYEGKWVLKSGPSLFPTKKWSLVNTQLEVVGNVLDKTTMPG